MPKTSAPSFQEARDSKIVRAAIHPAIGLARVGNSATEFFLAPQVTDPSPRPPGSYRDATGALKREAAEFRIYGYNQAGEVVGELTSELAEIAWSVHVANRKASWYQWQMAMDIPEAANVQLPLRNPTVTARDSLVIDAGQQTISGPDAPAVLCQGFFTGVPVKIGELQTDEKGRLLFLAGHGVAATPTGAPIYIPSDGNSFINADGWYDDTCDGPVDATVTIEGQSIPVEPAWVVTAPPNYAPQLKAVRTMYDLLYDLYVQAGWLPAPGQPSFTAEILPILQRLSGLQWVNQGFAVQFGYGGPYDFEDESFVQKLSTLAAPGAFDPHQELRQQIFNSFRPPAPADGNQLPWPWLYGDAMDVPAGNSPRQNASVSATQYWMLQRWVAGDFLADWGQECARPKTSLDQVEVKDQPAMLDRAALEFCLADAFHPGCELTWPMRHLTLYRKPFRVRQRAEGAPDPDYGNPVGQAAMLALNGPLHEQGPGDLSRWMGLPWHADTAWCRGGYDTKYDPFAPTFWPAHVPNHVLSATEYAIVVDKNKPPEQRVAAFANRTDWNKPLHGNTAAQMLDMVRIFGSMGLVEVQPGVPKDPTYPATMMVASYGPDVAPTDATSGAPVALPTPALLAAGAAPAAQIAAAPRPSAAHFATPEEGLAAPRPVRHPR